MKIKIKKLAVILPLFLTVFGNLLAQQTIEVKKISPRTVISVVKRVEQEYYLLTKNQPIEMTVTGPQWVRVYTRLLWQDNMTSSQDYKILVKEQDQEKLLTFQSELSTSAIGAARQKFSKWRSFYLEAPKGKTEYKFTLLDAKSDTVALRFSLEKPTDYKRITPEKPYKEMQFVEREKITNYYEVTQKSIVKVKVEGPAAVRVTCRLNYDYTMEGKQNYSISASVSGKEWQAKTFNTSKSDVGLYKNAAELVPSTPNTMYLDVPPGNFLIEFSLRSGLGKSAAISVSSKPKDFYE